MAPSPRGPLSTRSDPLLVALPVLAAVTAGLVAARIWLPAARLAERLIPRRSVAGRIALLGAVRRPLRAVATTAFLTAAVASVVFAGAYRSTLLQGSADQAAYAVPLDATLRSSASVPTPLALTSPDRIAALAAGIHAFGVVRSAGVVRTGIGDSVGLPVLGIDPASLAHVRRWSRTTGSDRTPESVAETLQRTGSGTAAPVLPAGTREVTLAVSGQLADTEVDLWLSTAAGREAAVLLKRNKAGDTLRGAVPRLGSGPLHVVALTIRETVEYATHHQHAIGEGNTDQPDLAGTFVVHRVTADDKPMAWDWSGWGSGLASATQRSDGLSVAYRLSGALVVVQPAYRASTTSDPLPVVVDPLTAAAASNGVLTLTFGSANISARVVGVLPRFPTTTGRFVVAGQPALSQVLDGQQPGTGQSVSCGPPPTTPAPSGRSPWRSAGSRTTKPPWRSVPRSRTSSPGIPSLADRACSSPWPPASPCSWPPSRWYCWSRVTGATTPASCTPGSRTEYARRRCGACCSSVLCRSSRSVSRSAWPRGCCLHM